MLRPIRFPGRCNVCRASLTEGQGYYDPDDIPRRIWCKAHIPMEKNTVEQIAKDLEYHAEADEWRPAKSKADPPARKDPSVGTETKVEKVDTDKLLAELVKLTADHYLTTVPDMVAQEFRKLAPRTLEIKVNAAPKVKIDQHHHMLPTILTAVAAGRRVFLVGPAGSGKTTLAEQVATALKRKFYMAARVTSEFKLLGFVDATGKTVRTQFREAYEHGGVFLFDEVDASDPDVMTAFNAALTNGYGDFPDGMVKMHKDFVAIAAGNTFGRGADRQYVGRNQLDAATLDRFVFFNIDYDETFELAIAPDPEWTKHVQKVRKAVADEKVRHIVSPRASIDGGYLLAAGMERKEVEEACIWKGLPITDRSRVEARIRMAVA